MRLLVGMVVFAVLVPYGITLALFWSQSSDRLSATESERQGVTYLRPLVQLLSAVADRQSGVLAGTTAGDQQLPAALRAVEAVDSSLGDDLGTHDRWTNVRKRLDAIMDSPPGQAAAYRDSGQVVDLISALVGSVADRSSLILDPDLDTYYLMDATVLRLPSIIVTAGRLEDAGRTSEGARSVEAIMLASGLLEQSGNLTTSLRKSFLASPSTSITAGLIPALDKFTDATTVLAPGLTGPGTEIPSGDRLSAARQQLRDTALDLETAALTQLDSRLQARADGLRQERWLIVGALIVGALLAGVGAPLLVRRRRDLDRAEAVRDARPDTGNPVHGVEGGPDQGWPAEGWGVAPAGGGPAQAGPPLEQPGADPADGFRWSTS
jgi:hypothetical protein